MTPLAKLDLNLLVALDALVSARSVTKAAQRLGVTQPAMSNALARLRRSLNDPLLVRGKGEMVPTPKALALAGPVREALSTLEGALESLGCFDPATSERSVRIAVTLEAQALVLPKLLPALAERAPKVRVELLGVPSAVLTRTLERGGVALAIGHSVGLGQRSLERQVLAELPWRCVSAEPPPASPEAWARAAHVNVTYPLVIDEALKQRGLPPRRVVAGLRGLAGLRALLRERDVIVTTLAPVAEQLSEGALHVSAPPVPLPPYPFAMLWHPRQTHDAAHCWLRRTLIESLGLTPPPACGAPQEQTCPTED